MPKTKNSPSPKSDKSKKIIMTHDDVQLEITFRETEPETNVKQNIITMLTTAYQDKINS